jgi:cytochrome d ubiquinol oxidase subunit II
VPDLLTLPNAVAAIILLSLTAYALLGGADFGGGVWDLLASGPRRRAQRALIADAIGPIWEANHVWLILVVVLLFTCFPRAFGALSVALHIPLTLMLVGIVLRGSAFTFRTYDSHRSAVQRRWGLIFAVASVVTPVMLGVCVGTIAAGRLVVPPAVGVTFASAYVAPWLAPFPLGVGGLALALFAFLAAVYLTVEAGDDALREDFRRRALLAAGAVFVLAFGLLLVARGYAPLVRRGLTLSRWALPFQALTGIAAVLAVWALRARRFRVARVAAAAQVSFILWGWALAQYPYLVPPRLTIAETAAPDRTLRLVLWTLAAGALILFPSLVYLFRIFKGRSEASRITRPAEVDGT